MQLFDDTFNKFWDLEAIGIKVEESSVYKEFTQNVVADTVYTFHGKAIIHHCLTTSTCARQDCSV